MHSSSRVHVGLAHRASHHPLPRGLWSLALVLALASTGCSAASQDTGHVATRVQSVQLTPDEGFTGDRDWFPALRDLLADPLLHPTGGDLSLETRAQLEAILEKASDDLDDIQTEFSAMQVRAARARIGQGLGERYVHGESSLDKGDYAAVVVLAVDDSGPWLVRIPHADLPQQDELAELHQIVRQDALVQLRTVIADSNEVVTSK